MTYSEILAEFIINLDYEKIPKNVLQRAKELMLDSFGTALAGANEQVVLNAIKALSSLPNSAGNTQIWGHKEGLRADLAAMCNGIAAHTLDFDDTHTEAILHASAILTPLCLSYGFSVNQNGKDILKAFIVGWEVGARVGIASKGSFHKKGFHTTAIAGAFAGVACVSVLLGFNKEQIINALGFAGSFASGVNEFLSNGSNSKVLHIANAIKNAIYIGAFAKNSMFAPRSIFEGRDNIFRAFGIEELCDKSKLTEGLNELWQVLQVSIKPYPSCHFAHGLIDCALELRKMGLKSDEIKSIHCFVDEVPSSFICDPINAKYEPKSAYEAKFSMPFLMALAFFDGNISLKSYENLSRAEILEFAKKITYEKKASSGFPKYFPGHIRVQTLKKSFNVDVDINRGNFDNPLSFEELQGKFLNNAILALSEKEALNLSQKILNLENEKAFL